MGPKALKIRLISVALAAAALFSSSTFAQSVSGGNAPKADKEPPPASNGNLGQADAFASAGEQAVFLGAYQMYFGPYGQANNPAERDKLIRETASAVDDCINNRACGADKQEKVLKALVQYNMGQDIKRAMLEMNTVRENMRSLDNSTDPSATAKRQGVLSQEQITKALASGRDVSVDQSDPIKPIQTNKIIELTRTTGPSKETYFQLDEQRVRRGISAEFMNERDILGDKFLKEYDTFLKGAGADPDERNFYKYVPAKNDGAIYVFDEQGRNGHKGQQILVSTDQEKRSQISGDMRNPRLKEVVAAYRKNLKPIRGRREGNVFIPTEGSMPSEIGVGEMAQIDPAKYPDIDFKDLMVNGQIPEVNQARAVSRVVNRMFADTAAGKEKENAQAGNLSRGIASQNKDPRWIHNITLSPEKFDQFLDEIWPTSASRQRILSQAPAPAPAGSGGRDPAQQAEPEEDKRDKYGKRLYPNFRPTDNNSPRRE